MFLLNLVFWEVYCTLNCNYCMYTKNYDRKFSDKEMNNYKNNIDNLKIFIDNKVPELKVVSLTWWEPTLFPQIIEDIYNKFSNKIIRISTNWTILHKKIKLNKFDPKKLFFAISLDWIELENNIFRFKNKENFNNILNNIDNLLKKWFSVEILTVLHPKSIDNYINLIKYLEKKYKKEIKDKKMWCIPFELVNYLNKDDFKLDQKTINNFLLNLEENINNYTLLSNYREYFYELIKYYKVWKINWCEMYKWALHIKYLKDSLWNHWKFLLYWCGSRGQKVLWQMDLNDPYEEDIIIERKDSIYLEKFFKKSDKACNKCFTNWYFYWFILNNKLSNIPKIFINN